MTKELENVDSHSSSIQWRGRSDTEVMLAAISHWGVYEATKRFTGMFSFALWDRNERSLYLVRDRVGEKPLYFGWVGETLLFGSELKALRSHPNWRGEIDRDALALYMQFNYIPAPYSIYKSIKKFNSFILIKSICSFIGQSTYFIMDFKGRFFPINKKVFFQYFRSIGRYFIRARRY